MKQRVPSLMSITVYTCKQVGSTYTNTQTISACCAMKPYARFIPISIGHIYVCMCTSLTHLLHIYMPLRVWPTSTNVFLCIHFVLSLRSFFAGVYEGATADSNRHDHDGKVVNRTNIQV